MDTNYTATIFAVLVATFVSIVADRIKLRDANTKSITEHIEATLKVTENENTAQKIINSMVDKLRAEIDVLRTEQKQSEAKIDELTQVVNDNGLELEKLKQRINELTNEIDQKEHLLQAAKDELNKLKDDHYRLEIERDTLQKLLLEFRKTDNGQHD